MSKPKNDNNKSYPLAGSQCPIHLDTTCTIKCTTEIRTCDKRDKDIVGQYAQCRKHHASLVKENQEDKIAPDDDNGSLFMDFHYPSCPKIPIHDEYEKIDKTRSILKANS